MRYIEIYNLNYPNIKIYIKDKSSYEIVKALDSGEIDIGILNMNTETNNSFNVIKKFMIQDCFVVGEKYKEICKKGLGVSCVIKDYIKKELEQELLYEVPVKEKIPGRIMGIATKKDTPMSKAAQRFVELICD